jgi:hypothetical protein
MRPKGIRIYFFAVQLHSYTEYQSETEYLIMKEGNSNKSIVTFLALSVRPAKAIIMFSLVVLLFTLLTRNCTLHG